GVDSSAVVALMAQASGAPVQTCTIGFDTAGLDETRWADNIAHQFNTAHHSRIVSVDDFAAIDMLSAAFDEPFADASALPTYRVCQLARESVTVALSGDGADEAFAGYRRYRFQKAEERVRGVLPAAVRKPVFGTLARYYPKADWAPQRFRAKATFAELALSGEEAYARAVSVLAPELRSSLYTDDFARQLQGHRAEDRYIAAMRAAPAAEPLDRAQYADMKIWLPGDILTKVDRASMAVSLMTHDPLLDYRLIEFAATLPVNMRIRGSQGKWLMKKALEPLLPHDTLYRPKMGFVTPISAWFRGALAAEARALTNRSRLADSGWFRMDVLGAMIADHSQGLADHGRLIWQMLMLEKALGRVFG
ncbi:MAG: asparagine synthetase B, partial [Alphaproteobacteria bacterium]|nr:asparagine synthetase B [Alphaproteobacteria bacterium]